MIVNDENGNNAGPLTNSINLMELDNVCWIVQEVCPGKQASGGGGTG